MKDMFPSIKVKPVFSQQKSSCCAAKKVWNLLNQFIPDSLIVSVHDQEPACIKT